MDGSSLALFELVLVLGGVLAFAVWEVIKLRRERRRDAERADDQRRGPPA